MESAVALANTLHSLLSQHPNKNPSDTEVLTALESYQSSRLTRVKEIFQVSWMLTRLQAYDGWLMYLVQRWVMPVVGLDVVAKNVAKTCSEAPKLDFVAFEEDRGTLGWKEGKEARDSKMTVAGGKEMARARGILPMVFGALVVFSSVLWLVVGGEGRQVFGGFAVIA